MIIHYTLITLLWIFHILPFNAHEKGSHFIVITLPVLKKKYAQKWKLLPQSTHLENISAKIWAKITESKLMVLSTLPPSLSHHLPQTSFSDGSRNHKTTNRLKSHKNQFRSDVKNSLTLCLWWPSVLERKSLNSNSSSIIHSLSQKHNISMITLYS